MHAIFPTKHVQRIVGQVMKTKNTLFFDHVCDLYASLFMVEDVCSLLLGRIYHVRVQCQQINSEYLQRKHVYV